MYACLPCHSTRHPLHLSSRSTTDWSRAGCGRKILSRWLRVLGGVHTRCVVLPLPATSHSDLHDTNYPLFDRISTSNLGQTVTWFIAVYKQCTLRARRRFHVLVVLKLVEPACPFLLSPSHASHVLLDSLPIAISVNDTTHVTAGSTRGKWYSAARHTRIRGGRERRKILN